MPACTIRIQPDGRWRWAWAVVTTDECIAAGYAITEARARRAAERAARHRQARYEYRLPH